MATDRDAAPTGGPELAALLRAWRRRALLTQEQLAGNPDGARGAWLRALELLEELDHPDAGQVRARFVIAADQVPTSRAMPPTG